MEPIRFPASQDPARDRARAIIKELSFKEGEFVLASGKKAKYYLDMKPTMFNPEGSSVLARLILDRLAKLPVDFVGGLEMGAVPLIAPITMISFERGNPIPGLFVRKEIKNHGTMKRIEGVNESDLRGKNVVVLDDVTTTGQSAKLAVDAIHDAGANVLLVLSIVDRNEGATEFYAKQNVPFDRLFTAQEFMSN